MKREEQRRLKLYRLWLHTRDRGRRWLGRFYKYDEAEEARRIAREAIERLCERARAGDRRALRTSESAMAGVLNFYPNEARSALP